MADVLATEIPDQSLDHLTLDQSTDDIENEGVGKK